MDECKLHHKPFEYYCENCNASLCGDCIFEQLTKVSDLHNNHNIIKIKEIKEKAFAALKETLEQLQDKYNLINNYINRAKNYKDQLLLANNQTQINMHDTFSNIKLSLNEAENVTNEQLNNLVIQLECLMNNVVELIDNSDYLLNLNEIIDINAIPTLINKIEKFVNEKYDFEFKKQSITWTNEIDPELVSYYWKIPNFISEFKNNKFKDKYSKVFLRYNCQWRVKITKTEKENLGIYLELLNGINEPVKFEYQIEIIYKKDNHIIKKKAQSLFSKMDSWGWRKFVSINQLNENDELYLCIKLRPLSYVDAARIGEKVLLDLKAKYKKLKHNYV